MQKPRWSLALRAARSRCLRRPIQRFCEPIRCVICYSACWLLRSHGRSGYPACAFCGATIDGRLDLADCAGPGGAVRLARRSNAVQSPKASTAAMRGLHACRCEAAGSARCCTRSAGRWCDGCFRRVSIRRSRVDRCAWRGYRWRPALSRRASCRSRHRAQASDTVTRATRCGCLARISAAAST